MESIEVRQKFIQLRAKGYSFDKISKELYKSKQTLVDWSRLYEEEISSLKAIELEALNEMYFLQKNRKIELFGEFLNAIKNELSSRNLRDVPTEKLMDLFLKYYSYLESEKIEPSFKTSTQIKSYKEDRRFISQLTGISEEGNETSIKMERIP